MRKGMLGDPLLCGEDEKVPRRGKGAPGRGRGKRGACFSEATGEPRDITRNIT